MAWYQIDCNMRYTAEIKTGQKEVYPGPIIFP